MVAPRSQLSKQDAGLHRDGGEPLGCGPIAKLRRWIGAPAVGFLPGCQAAGVIGTRKYPAVAEGSGYRPGSKAIGRGSVPERPVVTVSPAVGLVAGGGTAGVKRAGRDLTECESARDRGRLVEGPTVTRLSVVALPQQYATFVVLTAQLWPPPVVSCR